MRFTSATSITLSIKLLLTIYTNFAQAEEYKHLTSDVVQNVMLTNDIVQSTPEPSANNEPTKIEDEILVNTIASKLDLRSNSESPSFRSSTIDDVTAQMISIRAADEVLNEDAGENTIMSVEEDWKPREPSNEDNAEKGYQKVSNNSSEKLITTAASTISTPVHMDKLPSTSQIVAMERQPEEALADDEPELNNDNEFLPFAEWKKLKLNEKQRDLHNEKHLRTMQMLDYNKLESFGDDMEIDVRIFTSLEDDEPEGKVYHEKFNFASLDCAASIVKTNSEAQGASSILYENKDKYLLNPCSAPSKFVVIELCQDILVEDIHVANYEFFSSTFKRLRFSVSDRFPVPKNGWKILGEFEAENSRDLQKFKIANPMIWARYLRVEILEHYGKNFYCPISVVRAHGKTMMDEFKMTKSTDIDVATGELECESVSNINILNSSDLCDANTYPEYFDGNKPLIFSNRKMTGELFWGELQSQCRAALPPLRFEEFIKDFNAKDTSKQLKPVEFTPLSTEESIFKNIMKRISSLETNSTLSVLYIEEQSRLLSKSFSSLEKTHGRKFDSLVAAFNETMMANLESLNNFAKQLQESSLKLLEEQKLSNDQFTTMTIQRLDMMEKDARFQKRMMYLILFAFASLLMYILLTREAYVDEYMEDDGWYLDSPPLKKAKDKILKKAARAVSSPTIFGSFNAENSKREKYTEEWGIRTSTSRSGGSHIDNDNSDEYDREDYCSNISIRRGRTYSKLLAADEMEVDIDDFMSNSSDNFSVTYHGMDRAIDDDGIELSSRASSSDKESI
ncbi:HCL612Wp [Eremothecium sinecaudum]|uniref:SUN-like protein 1 n=1 Tax=Eremothecium sinecaudum TaxID=45286 RepID=A0A109UXY1_9SACH|nr:HCL612Wp [Eremothecium sinecaudum]AMD19539.1 HCL612Wp [Eremothecium sinecaudum]